MSTARGRCGELQTKASAMEVREGREQEWGGGGKKVGKESGVCTKRPKTNTKETKGSEQETKTRDRG